MSNPKVLIVRAAGTNCDGEAKFACEKVGFSADIIHISKVLQKPEILKSYHFFIIPGGFTYGDDLGAGKILATQIKYNLLEHLRNFINEGKLMLGICNGFQVLVKCGILPRLAQNGSQDVTLTFNDSYKFEDRWVSLKVCSKKSEFIKEGDGVIELPVAHGEGKFYPKDRTIYDGLVEKEQVVLKYVKTDGSWLPDNGAYPYNPNGSIGNVAGICDPTGRVLGLMPHPERYTDPLQHPQWTRKNRREKPHGIKFFENAFSYIKRTLL